MQDNIEMVSEYRIVQKIPIYGGDSKSEPVLIINTNTMEKQYEVTMDSSAMMCDTPQRIKKIHFVEKPTITFMIRQGYNGIFTDFGLKTHTY